MKKTFKEKVLAAVRKIRPGKVLTYKEVAKRAGNSQAYRVVANYMAKNYDRTVPCHRVIRSDGGLGGYNRGGILAKKRILKAEGYKFS